MDGRVVQEVYNVKLGPLGGEEPGGWLIAVASGLLLLLAGAQGYVSWAAQYSFVLRVKGQHLPSVLEALGLDAAAVIFALLGLALARRGAPATVERILNVLCAAGSLGMNALSANLGSPRSVAVWVLPAALYATASDRLIAVVRRRALRGKPQAREGSPWRAAGGAALWLVRLACDRKGTLSGFRSWVLEAAPVAPGRRAISSSQRSGGGNALEPGQEDRPVVSVRRRPGESARQALIRAYDALGADGDPRHGDRAAVGEVARELYEVAGLAHPATARNYLHALLDERGVPSAGERADRMNGQPVTHLAEGGERQ